MTSFWPTKSIFALDIQNKLHVVCLLQNAVVKLKVVPPVHVSTHNNVIDSAGNGQVIVRNSGIGKETTKVSAVGGSIDTVSESAVDSNQHNKSSAHIKDDWSDVKAAKSPHGKKTNSTDSAENQLVINLVEQFSMLCFCLMHDSDWCPSE